MIWNGIRLPKQREVSWDPPRYRGYLISSQTQFSFLSFKKKKICFCFRIWFSWPVWSVLCWGSGLHGPVSPATSPSVVGVSQTWICGLFERRVGLKLIVMSSSIHSCNESLNRYLLDIFNNCNHLFDIRNQQIFA